jgi:hypothetical protein
MEAETVVQQKQTQIRRLIYSLIHFLIYFQFSSGDWTFWRRPKMNRLPELTLPAKYSKEIKVMKIPWRVCNFRIHILIDLTFWILIFLFNWLLWGNQNKCPETKNKPNSSLHEGLQKCQKRGSIMGPGTGVARKSRQPAQKFSRFWIDP